ncbi:MAG: phosphoribosylaminoimidazolecarboxamide formyltransferase / cyclohydrolase [Actinomycetota bacterium]|nr:phosphoribosylaminoimidazolecarboxamide formyltransferase / cyclohydrolase [Actinomycetota bacterium]
MSEQHAAGARGTGEGDREPSCRGRAPIRRALISVYDKTGLLELARGLAAAGVTLVSTGSTAARIAADGIPVTPVEQVTGFPECLDGRVKTLHPAVHAGILADRRRPEHCTQLKTHRIAAFDLVVVNLYPFEATVASGAEPADCVEQIDIGGPAMIRSAAKNHDSVAVVVDPEDYTDVLASVASGGFCLSRRRQLAAKAFAHTASYDVAVAGWMERTLAPDTAQDTAQDGCREASPRRGEGPAVPPRWLGAAWQRRAVLRYGENPHQRAALYGDGVTGIAGAEQLHGKEMSYNNYVDIDAAWRAAHDHDLPCVAIIKHANPCGLAVGTDLEQAYRRALEGDPLSAYGGVVALNGTLTLPVAERISEVFTEVVAAPHFDPAALELLTRKRNIRLLRVRSGPAPAVDLRPISGGALLQSRDLLDAPGDAPSGWELACGAPADDQTMADLRFAWRSVRAVKSNAILLAKDGASVGIGMGQVNRVDSCKLAVSRAGADRAAGAVAASDAYFPFADGLQILLDAGVRAVVQPGGSKRDPEVLAAADAANVTLYLTGTRHFSH